MISRRIVANVLHWVALCVGLIVAARPVAAEAPPDTSLTKEVLGDGIYLFRAPSALDLWTATNVVVIVNDQDVTVFDSNTRARTARMVIAEIRKITPKPVRTLINSHWHQDHWSGNDEYVKAFPGIQIVATTKTRDYMKHMGSRYFADGLNTQVARQRAALDTAVRTGKQSDGTPLTAGARQNMEKEIDETAAFVTEVANVKRVLPTIAYNDSLVLWSSGRELRLISVTGDATGSTVLYLPAEKILVMGDALVTQEEGNGPPPWTTTSYSITPWLNSLRGLERLDATIVVPGQGPAFHDKAYLKLTGDLFESIITQVHAALERGLVTLAEVQAAVNVDSIGRQYTPNATGPDPRFKALVSALVRKVHQESLDGVSRP
ncbi:MAG TPA: MBL fold metallo-hydrolase [Gemmatimonadaceae bacterium]|nr:MBL fold metallo-hydrolase [Gemmatimonadaceae bacterium]